MENYITLDINLVNRINLILNKSKSFAQKLEIIVGKFRKGFIPNVGETEYTKLFNCLKNNKSYTHSHHQQTPITQNYDYFDVDLTQFNIRIYPSKYTTEKIGDTHIFTHTTESYSIKLFNPNSSDYQVFVNFSTCNLDIKSLFSPLKILFYPITKTRHLISYSERKQVILHYNSIIKKQSKNPIILFNKPQTLNRTHLGFLLENQDKFLVFPKLDGIRYFMFIMENSIYLLNYTEFLKYSDNESSDYNKTIIDGELIDNIFYPFDILFWKGEDVRKLDRLSRLGFLKELDVSIPIKIIEPDTNLTQGFKKYYETPQTDGIIMVYRDVPYNNSYTYKFKPHYMQYIDFYIQDMKLMIKTPNGIEPFKGTPQYPYSGVLGNPDNFDIKNESIVECKWSDNMFIPVRERTDKINPNFIDVANIIWEEINNPIMPSDFLNIHPVPPNRIEKFYTPIYDNIYRVGTLSEGSCLLHSILNSSSEKYREMTIVQRMEFVKNLRLNLAKNLSLEEWKKLGNGMVAMVTFQECFVIYFEKIYDTIIQLGNPNSLEKIYHEIFSLHSKDYYRQHLLEKITIDDLENNIEFTFRNTGYSKFFTILINEIRQVSLKTAYQQFCEKLSNPHQWIDDFFIDYISKKFNKNIYFISAKTRMPYTVPSPHRDSNCIVVLYFENSHFEAIQHKDQEDNIIYEFSPDSIFIQNILKYKK